MERFRYRLRFAKQHDLRLISHRDLVRTLERLFRRAGLALKMSEGFHPKPRLSFPLPMAVGTTGLDEVLELELTAPRDAQELRQTLNAQAVPGLEFLHCELLPMGAGKAQAYRFAVEATLPADRAAVVQRRLAELAAQPNWPVARKQDVPPFDAKPLVDLLDVRDGVVRMRLWFNRQGSVRPSEVLGLLGLDAEEIAELPLVRTQVELDAGDVAAASAADDFATTCAAGAQPIQPQEGTR